MPEEKHAHTILVVEDEEALQDAIRLKLTNEGFRVISAMSGERALEVLKTEKPELIWLDLLLPGMGGLQFLEHIRKSDDWKNIPVFVVSAGPEKIQRAFELNVVDYIVKSQYKLEDIVKRVGNFLAGK